MIEINLIPDVKQDLIKAQRIRTTVITMSILISLVAVGAVVLLAIYVFTVQSVRSGLADKDINDGSSQLSKVNDLSKTLTIQNQLTKIPILNDAKKIDSRIFDVLNAIIPPDPNSVQISNLNIDSATGLVTIDGQAQNSYTALEIFKKTIDGTKLRYTDSENKKQEISLASNIETSNTSYGEDSSGAKVLRFTITFVYTPELFSPLSKNTTIAITVNGNVTDSYLGVPKSIFTNSTVQGGK